MKYIAFLIVLITNIILLYPLVQYNISKPKIVIQTVYKDRNVAPDDKSAFGDALIIGADITNGGHKLKEYCPNGVKNVNLNPVGIVCK